MAPDEHGFQPARTLGYIRSMGMIDDVLRANEEYARRHALRHISSQPQRRLVVVTCMDTRIIEQALGLAPGDAHILRNAGGVVTQDVIRSLVLSYLLFETEEIMIVNHTECGLMVRTEQELQRMVLKRLGVGVTGSQQFFAFADIEANVRKQIAALQSHPWIPREMTARGFIYDVKTGHLREVI